MGYKFRPGCSSTGPVKHKPGTETKLSGQGQRLSQTNLWHELNYGSLSDALPIPGNGAISLDPDPSSGVGEDKAGFFHSGTELSHLVVNETLSTWGQSFIYTPINLTITPHPSIHGSPKCFSCNSISTGNKNTRIEKIIVTAKFSTLSREKVK